MSAKRFTAQVHAPARGVWLSILVRKAKNHLAQRYASVGAAVAALGGLPHGGANVSIKPLPRACAASSIARPVNMATKAADTSAANRRFAARGQAQSRRQRHKQAQARPRPSNAVSRIVSAALQKRRECRDGACASHKAWIESKHPRAKALANQRAHEAWQVDEACAQRTATSARRAPAPGIAIAVVNRWRGLGQQVHTLRCALGSLLKDAKRLHGARLGHGFA